MESENNKSPDTFPMCRVTRIVPGTDTGLLRPHYEISVSDPDPRDGYRPVALVMQSILGSADQPKVRGSSRIEGFYELFPSSVEQLSAAEQAELRETGLYSNPSDQSRLAEVHTIMGLIVSQADANADQPALPLPFQSVAY
jgi:hypothetical protein